MPTKKDPEGGLVASNDKFASSEVNTCGKKKAPDEPDEPPKEESKNGGIITDTEIISVLYDCARLASGSIYVEHAGMGIKQQQRELDSKWTKTKGLQLLA